MEEEEEVDKDDVDDEQKNRFSDVRTLLLFIGYPRSGSTLVGSLLDAHPNIVIANEYNLIAHWKNYTTHEKNKGHVFNELWMNSVREATNLQRAQRKNFFFSYHIPDMWQGRYSGSIKVSISMIYKYPPHTFR